MSFEDDRGPTRTLVVKEQDASTAQRKMRAVVTLASGPDLGRVIALPAGEVLSIGRGEDQKLRCDDAAVSSNHARLVAIAGEYMFVDNKSTNGSFINDERVEHPKALKDGDRIRLGPNVFIRFSMVDEDEEAALRKIYEAALFDGLTKVFNRKHLEDRLDAEIAFAIRHDSELSLIMFDVDHFKKVNDTYGHPGGDAVLMTVGQLLMKGRRTEDMVARYGGEEFALALRGTPVEGAAVVAERLRASVEASAIPFEDKLIKITASSGVASLKCCGARRDKATLVTLADQRLYRAKQAGRNRVISVGPP